MKDLEVGEDGVLDMMLGQVAAGDPGATRAVKAEIERLRGIERRAIALTRGEVTNFPSSGSGDLVADVASHILEEERS